jgi:putative transposase
MMDRAYKFRIYPDAKRQSEIDERLVLAQKFYNKILEKSITSHQNGRANISMAQFNRFVKEIIKENKEYLKLYSQTRCEIEYRVLKAYQNFFRRCREKKNGKRIKVGFPRFKSRDFYRSIVYPQDNGAFSIEKNMLRISRIGRVQIEFHRQIEGKIKTMTIKRVAGKYFAIFSAVQDCENPEITNSNPVGIDVGLKTFAVLSDGSSITKPKFKRNAQKRLAIWQRRIARKVKGSRNREKAKLQLQREWEDVNSRNDDFIQKETTRLANSGYTSFAFEDLSITNMMKNHCLADAIQSSCWEKFQQVLSYKAESAGMRVEYINPRNTTKTCSNCGNIMEIGLGIRTYECGQCGLSMNRDLNASINILNRATAGHAGRYASGDSTSTLQRATQVGSMNRNILCNMMCRGSPHALAVGGCHKQQNHNLLVIT